MPRVLITGANRGIGLAFVRSFAADDWAVHALCRQPEKAKDLREIADASDGGVTVHRVDVTDGLRVASLARELSDFAIDVLINNAGVYASRSSFGDTDFAGWTEELKVNTIAPLRMVERFVEHLARSDRKLVVNVSSKMGSIAENSSGGSYIYRSGKAALNIVSRSLSHDLAERGITVIPVHPGWVQTDMGGPAALITAEESVAGLRKLIDRVGPEESGRFFNYDGTELPW